MDYNENRETTEVISNINQGLVGKAWGNGPHVITGNLNQPIKFNLTNMEDKLCGNQVMNGTDGIMNGANSDVTNEGLLNGVDHINNTITNKILNKPDLKFSSNAVTWQQMSPKKEKKNSSSGSSSDTSSSGDSQSSGLKTWASVKKNSIENMELKSGSNSGHSCSSTSSSSSGSNTSPTRTWSTIKQETNKNNTLTRKDSSPTKRCYPHDSQENDVLIKNLQNSSDTSTDSKIEDSCGLDNCSYASPTHGEKRTIRKVDSNDCDNSSTSLPPGNSQEDGMSNDYFYDEDFTVQFDTNLRESTPHLDLGPPSTAEETFPNMVTGSYLSFKNTKSSGIVQNGHAMFCPDESEISVSRHSQMDVSSSEREMMCSSDMLDFSDNPLFTPPLSGDVHMASQEDSTDSLDKVAKEKAQAEMNGSETSSDGNVNYDCFPRKEDYFLSFDGSAGHTESYSEQSNSMNSNCSSQGQNHINVCSNEDVGDESSESFHVCMAGNNFHKKAVGSRLTKFQTLTALQEQTSELSGSSQYSDEKPCSEPATSPTKRTFRRLSPTKGRQLKLGQKICFACHLNNSCGESHSSPTRSRSRQKSVTSWKQVKSLKKLGKLDNILDPSRSRSMPDICLRTWQSGSSLTCHGHDVHRIAESFHCKRHSAYLLDLYQRVRNQSNPVSPECMSNIEQILFHNVVCKESKIGNSGYCDFCREGSHSTNTLTGSHLIFKDGKLGYDTHKRILDWLDREKQDNKINKSCQTESLVKNKDTVVSPSTVTLWCGTKNFGNQYPPCSQDCAIQTNVLELANNTKEYGQQTTPTLEGKPEIPRTILKEKNDNINQSKEKSPFSYAEDSNSLDKNDILNLISHDFQEVENLIPKPELLKPKVNASIPRSKSADSGKKQANKVRRNVFYSHKSLPDLSFVDFKQRESRHDDGSGISLFDPLPIAMPVPVFIPAVVDSEKVTKSLSSRLSFENLSNCSRSHSRSRSRNARPHSAPARSHTSPSPLPRHCAESGSSSSGFTSSTSSGIDPGYSDRCTHNSSPSTDIERLIFYPPHVENTYKGDYLNENLNDSGNISMPSTSDKSKLSSKTKPADQKVPPRCANEVHPSNIETKTRPKPSKSSSHCSSNGSLQLDHLYALKEEQTPVSSPERDHCHHETEVLYGNAYCVNCCKGQGHIEGWENEEVVVRRRKFDYHLQLSSESGSSGSGSFFPNFDKKPLKSCLRKRQFLRTRSLSDHIDLEQDEQSKNSCKKNRHSYACEEIILLQDETGEYFVCKNDESEAQPVVLYIEERSCDSPNKNIVKLRPKKEIKDNETESEKELNGKRKSVSFASEVSFHAISPHLPGKRASSQEQEVTSDQQEVTSDQQDVTSEPQDVTSEQQDVTSDKQEVTTEPQEVTSLKTQADGDGNDSEVKQSCDSDDSPPPSEFKVSPSREITPEPEKSTNNIKALLSDISSAAESLVEHFASAKTPFDKLRLGSSAYTPEIGDLVLSRLCPAVHHVIEDGLKTHLTGVQVFGRVQVTAWKLAEASVEQGPYTRAIHDLVQQLKSHTGLDSHSNKFDGFVFGLLNLRLLDYWLGYLRHNKSIVEKFYNPDAVMSLSGTLYEQQYSEVLISLQPLAVLPFQLSIEFITIHSTSNTKDGSPKKNNSVDLCMTDSFSKEKAIIGVAASKAWDWLKNGAAKSPSDELPSPPILTGNVMISSITGILGKLSGSSKSNQEPEQVVKETITNGDVDRPIVCGGPINNIQTDVVPPAKPPRANLTLDLVNKTSPDVDKAEGNQSRDTEGNQGKENVMLSSFNGMAQKLLGIKHDKLEKLDKEMESTETQSEEKSQPLVVKREKKENSDFDAEKTKSGLIRLFDKLLLPRDSSKKEQKLKRWSWGYGQGQGQQVKPVTLATKPQSLKTDLKSPSQSKLPSYKGGNSSSKPALKSKTTSKSLEYCSSKPLSTSDGKQKESASKTLSTSEGKQKDFTLKPVKDRAPVKSKVPVRKTTSSYKISKDSKPKPVDSTNKNNVPKDTDSKWQGGVTLSASLEEGPTLKAPPSVSLKTPPTAIPEKTVESETTEVSCNGVTSDSYQDAKTSDSSENLFHISDEINCNSPVVVKPNEQSDAGFRKPNFRFVQTVKSSDQSAGDFHYSVGDQFEVLAQLDSDWLYCINGKKEGLIRLENVRPITDEEEFQKLHSDFYS